MRHFGSAVRHGDLWYGNLLIRANGGLCGVLDWEAVAVADPAQDLATNRYLGPQFESAVIASYLDHGGEASQSLRYRIERHWELRELTGVPLAAAAGDEREIGECIGKLRAGPILG